MKYKELEEFFGLAHCDMVNFLEQIGETGEVIDKYHDPELNLLLNIICAQELICKAIKEYERIIKRKRHQNPVPEIQKTKKEIDDWIQVQNAKKSAGERKKRTQTLIILGSTYLPILDTDVKLDDSKVEKLRKILNRNRDEILEILDDDFC